MVALPFCDVNRYVVGGFNLTCHPTNAHAGLLTGGAKYRVGLVCFTVQHTDQHWSSLPEWRSSRRGRSGGSFFAGHVIGIH